MQVTRDELDMVVQLSPAEALERIRRSADPDRLDPTTWTKQGGVRPYLFSLRADHRFTIRVRAWLPNPYQRELVGRLESLNGGTRIRAKILLPGGARIVAAAALLIFVGLPLIALILPLGYRNTDGLRWFLAFALTFLVAVPLASRAIEGDARRLRLFLPVCFPEARSWSAWEGN